MCGVVAGFKARCVWSVCGERQVGGGERGKGDRGRGGEVMSGQVLAESLRCLVLFANSLLLSLQ